MPRILISYRRADSDAIASRIRDQLAAQYRSDSVFMDIDSVPVGVDFREQIKSEIDKDDLVLAIIGPRWRGPRRGGRTRINDPDDFVRVELETALGRSIPVIPVLVDGMKMPKPEDLPDSLKKLSFHNAAKIFISTSIVLFVLWIACLVSGEICGNGSLWEWERLRQL